MCVHTNFLSDGGLDHGDTVMKRDSNGEIASQCGRQTCKSAIAIARSSKHTGTSCKVQNKVMKVSQKQLAAVKEGFKET